MEKVIIKIGGSIITDRDKYCTTNMDNLRRICQELKKSISEKNFQMILIIGAGSYGHQTMHEYNLHRGLHDRTQLYGLKKVANNLWKNGEIVSEVLAKYDLPSYCIHTPSYLTSKNGEIEELFYQPIEYFLNGGIIPIIWGDINFDRNMIFTNVSGDKIAIRLVEYFKPYRVLFFTDVDGVMMNFNTPEEELVESITKSNYHEVLSEIKNPTKIDVNGGMIIKYQSIGKLLDTNVVGYIGNGNKQDIIYRALVHKDAPGTYFTAL